MERRKKRIVKLTAFLFLLAASIFVMPQKAFADENVDEGHRKKDQLCRQYADSQRHQQAFRRPYQQPMCFGPLDAEADDDGAGECDESAEAPDHSNGFSH